MNLLWHSRIDGVLEGKGNLSEFFAILKKKKQKKSVTLCGPIRTCMYSIFLRFLYLETTVTNTISIYKETEIRLQIRVMLADIYCSVIFSCTVLYKKVNI
jgi:hypothetical protein